MLLFTWHGPYIIFLLGGCLKFHILQRYLAWAIPQTPWEVSPVRIITSSLSSLSCFSADISITIWIKIIHFKHSKNLSIMSPDSAQGWEPLHQSHWGSKAGWLVELFPQDEGARGKLKAKIQQIQWLDTDLSTSRCQSCPKSQLYFQRYDQTMMWSLNIK